MSSASITENLAIISVQFSAVSDDGIPLCFATYLTEGDDPMIFCVYITLENLDCYVVAGPTFGEYSRTRKQYSKSALLVNPLREYALKLLDIN